MTKAEKLKELFMPMKCRTFDEESIDINVKCCETNGFTDEMIKFIEENPDADYEACLDYMDEGIPDDI